MHLTQYPTRDGLARHVDLAAHSFGIGDPGLKACAVVREALQASFLRNILRSRGNVRWGPNGPMNGSLKGPPLACFDLEMSVTGMCMSRFGDVGDRYVHVFVIALRPSKWLTANDLGEGKWARVYIKEKTSFVGRIEKIEPAPAIEDGPGRVVTATLFNRGKEVIELHIASQPEPIEVTASHLLYSATRDRYVPAGDLLEGECLKTREGRVAIEQIDRLGAVAQVFDIEVEGDHHYYVSGSGVLSHNCGEDLSVKNWAFDKSKDIDWRGKGYSYRDAIDEAFRRTGVLREQFTVKRWGY